MFSKLRRIIKILTYITKKVNILIVKQNIISHNFVLNNYYILKKVHKVGTNFINIANLILIVFYIHQ